MQVKFDFIHLLDIWCYGGLHHTLTDASDYIKPIIIYYSSLVSAGLYCIVTQIKVLNARLCRFIHTRTVTLDSMSI